MNGYPGAAVPKLELDHVPNGWAYWAAMLEDPTVDPEIKFRYQGNFFLNEDGLILFYPEGQYLTDVLGDRAVDFIESQAPGSDPFFLWLSLYTPHFPAHPASRHTDALRPLPVPRTPAFNEADVSDKSIFYQLPILDTKAINKLDRVHRRRWEAMLAVDEMVGLLFATLRANRWFDSKEGPLRSSAHLVMAPSSIAESLATRPVL